MKPSLERLVLAKGAALAMPLRWFSLPQCFRYEQAQKGRKREHYQWNMDIIGMPGVAAEAELMAAQVAFLKRTGLNLEPGNPDIVWKVSNRQVIQHFLIYSQGFTVPAGETYVPIEGPRGEHGCFVVSDGTNRPWRVKMRPPSFMAIQALPGVVQGGLIGDVVAVIGSTDVVMGDCDR